MEINNIKAEHKVFSENYVIDWDGTAAYMIAYPNATYESAKASASRLLTDVNVQAYIKEIQEDLGKLCGISASKVILELKKIAFTDITDFKDGWLTEKAFDELTSDQKSALSEIQYVDKENQYGSEKIVKFKVHDKHRALETINKMLGYNAVVKSEVEVKGDLTPEERQRRINELKGK